jgi:hypothetical protein
VARRGSCSGIEASPISDNNPGDLVPSLGGVDTPKMQQVEQRLLIGIELLQPVFARDSDARRMQHGGDSDGRGGDARRRISTIAYSASPLQQIK